MKNSFGDLCRKMLAEVHNETIASIEPQITALLEKEKHHFDKIFKNKTRIVIPLGDENQSKFLEFLEQKGLTNINLTKGTGERKTTSTKDANKHQVVTIGKFLNKLEDGKQWLRWWEQNKGKKSDGVSIVISRSPIDIVRMSDHKDIRSCHSKGGSWFHCAVQEAKTGGAVAYIVKDDDLKNVPDLQAREIFADPDRNIKGIQPLERLRLRRFEDEDADVNFLVPELRTYGKNHIEFYERVKDWALKNQKDELEELDWDNINLRGGSYQDNEADEIWNAFLDDTQFEGEKISKDKADEKGTEEEIDTQAERMVRAHPYKHYHVDYNIHGADDQIYISSSAMTQFELEFKYLNKIPKEKDIDETMKIELARLLSCNSYNLEIDIDNELEIIKFNVLISNEDELPPKK
jgi:hypothetical protein